MKVDATQQTLLRQLPGVDVLLESIKTDPFFEGKPRSVVTACIRTVLDHLRRAILAGDTTVSEQTLAQTAVLAAVKAQVQAAIRPNLRPVVNASGVVVHTNLGRSVLADDAIANLVAIAGGYSNLEFDLAQGTRGSRYSAVEDILCAVSGAEAALVVNNNAAAVLLALESLAAGKKVIVSRGELVEIGGSFRIPDVMAKSGGILKEVGTTNRTHLKDYENAIENDTGLLLKVHTSNYSIVGFTAQVALSDLVALGARYHLPVMEDLGSGTLIDFASHGLLREPTVQASVAAGADIITFSGDKLLGGPQAGIIVGKKEFVDRLKKNPLTRALRIDKLTLAALETTLRHYQDPEKAVQHLPTLRMLTLPVAQIESQTQKLAARLKSLDDPRLRSEPIDLISKAGGGALPLLNLPSRGLHIEVDGLSPNALERHMRANEPPIIGRIEEDRYVLDLRTVQEDELDIIQKALADLVLNI